MAKSRVQDGKNHLGHNREAWLTELARVVEPLFKGFTMQPYRLTCGWPCRGATGKVRAIGECHALQSSKGGVHEIFISPVIADPLQVAGVVCHELAHVAAGIEAQHGKGFVKVCRHVGLTSGKPKFVGPGPLLIQHLEKVMVPLGPYPHQVMELALKPAKPRSTLSLLCIKCGCKVTMSLKWLEEAGAPTCACGGAFVEGEQ